MLKFKLSSLGLLAGLLLLVTACTETAPIEGVVYRSSSDPEQMNPYTTSDATASTIFKMTFQTLVNIDFEKLELIPVLAKNVAKWEETPEGKLTMTYELKEDATWDNGTPITAKDVEFSLKVMMCPKVDNAHAKPYFEHIEAINIDPSNNRKFVLVCKEPYLQAEAALTDLLIIPQYVYDKDNLLAKFTYKQLLKDAKALEEDATINQFAEGFNGDLFQREVMVGSGPYAFDRWNTNQRFILKRKANWWGSAHEELNHWFQAHPKTIIYETITDPTTAVVALKGGKINVMDLIPSKDFVTDLQTNESFKKKFSLHTPPYFAYGYMGINTRNEKFKDKKTRQALTHIMDVDKYIKTVSYGMAERVTTIVHPSKPKYINPALKPYPHDLDKAKALLAEAGWEDSDGNGFLDRMVDGEIQPFEIEFIFPNSSKNSEKAGLMFQESARLVGIKVSLSPLEWSVQLDRTKNHDYDMYIAAWVASALEGDPKQIWHTDSYNAGSNYVGFGDATTDKIIEDYRHNINEEERIKLLHELQAVIYEEAPYIFLTAAKNRLAIDKVFTDPLVSAQNPGFWAPNLKALEAIAD